MHNMIATSRRLRLLCGIVFFVASVLLLPAVSTPSTAGAQEAHHAALVVDFDGRVVVRVVTFTEETISGVDLLQRSGLDVALMMDLGGAAALCAVEGVGCPPTPQDCFCQCRGGECRYWSYFHLREGAWVYASVGAADRVLRDGDVDGWVWGDGRTAPPLLTWDEIWSLSRPAEPTLPVLAPVPTDTPVPPTAVATPVPPSATATVTAASTALPDVTALPTNTALPGAADQAPTISSPLPTSVPSATTLLVEAASPAPTGGDRGGGEEAPAASAEPLPYSALGFGGIALLLVAIGLWVRRRR